MSWTVLFTCVLHQLAECQVILDFWLNLPVQHVSLRTAQPLAAFLSCDCGSICYAADLAEASPRQGSWPWCLTSPSDILPLPSGDERILTATVRKRPVTTREKLCFFLSPSSIFVLTNQPGMPVSMQDLLGKLSEESCSGISGLPHSRSSTSSEDLAVNQNLHVECALRTKQECYNLSLPL